MNNLDITIDQGATFTQRLTIKSSDGSNIADIATTTIASQLRVDYSSSDIAASFTFSWIDHTNGIVDMILTAPSSAALTGVRYVYDVNLTFASGVVIRLLEGRAKVRPEVTK